MILLCSLQTRAALLCFAFALHCAGHFVADEQRQDPYKFGTFPDAWNLEPWKPGTPEPW